MTLYRRDTLTVALLGLAIGAVMAALLLHPGYVDAYYYFNAGQRLVQGKGLTDAALWTYIGLPPGSGLPVPSHLYWMPLASLVAAVGMIAGPMFGAAKLPFVLIYAGLGVVGFQVGASLGGSRRVAWMAGLLTLFSGFFMPYWVTTDTFAIYGLTGSLALVTMGRGRATGDLRCFAISGGLAGLAHLARADGVLLVVVLVIVALWPSQHAGAAAKRRIAAAGLGILAYLVVMTPWFVRNLSALGSPLPVGGAQTALMRSYDEIANYPVESNLVNAVVRFAAWGPGNILRSRWDAFVLNLQTLIAVEGLVVLSPFIALALWRRRFDPRLSGVWLYALGLHAVMTLVFPFPGTRGGLFHSAAALLPFWMALGVLGIDDALGWVAARRRRWRLVDAQRIFGGALIAWGVIFSLANFSAKMPGWNHAGDTLQALARILPADAVVMINDPSALYYFTGLSGVVVPNAPPTVIPDLAKRYGVTHVVLDANRTGPMDDLYQLRVIPFFLSQISTDAVPTDIRIFKVKPPDGTLPTVEPPR